MFEKMNEKTKQSNERERHNCDSLESEPAAIINN